MADVEKIKLNGSSLNIKDANAVSVESQSLTAQQKTQARENIGAASVDSVPTSLAELSDDSTHRLVTDVEKTTWNSTIPSTAKGASNGVAELDSNGKVPSSQLPSFVDDVIEGYYSTLDDRFYEESAFTTLIEPVAGKSWVDIPANKSYRWTGSVYVRVDEGVQIGETSDTAYAGNKGKANADAITAINEVIPSTATSQNPLATAADIPTDAVKYTAQTLTDAQKTQARQNIGVVQPDWNAYNSVNPDFIKNKPLVKVGQGTGGNLISGTGLENNTNEAKKLNSIAHGRNVTANGNYSIAAGQYVQANNDYEIAYGKCNQSNADTVFSIGDGVDTQNRHNLMELKTDGTLLLNGNAVKTEGGDDNKRRLGTICAAYVNPAASSNLKAYNIGFGFNGVFGAGSTVTTIDFSVGHCTSETNIYRAFVFGDFIGYKSENTSTTIYVRSTTVSSVSDGKIYVVGSCMSMFANCQALTTLDLSLFDTSKTKVMSNMFANCQALTTLDLSSFDMTNAVVYTGMFTNDTALTTLKTPKINPHDDIPLPCTLYSQDGTAYTNLPVTTGTSIELRQSWT